MSLKKNIITLFALSILAMNASAREYPNSFYEDEGDLFFKVRGMYIHTDSKLKKLPASVNEAPKSITSSAYGADGAVTYFVTSNLAAELSLGFGIMRVKNNELIKARNAFGSGFGTIGKRNEIFYVPATAIAQYHVAPFGGLRPYVGAGYNGTFMHTRSKAIKVGNGHGPVIQAGVDFVAKDDTVITFDIRQYFLKTDLTFKKGFLSPNNINATDVKSKVTWNPLVISFGVGFKF